VSLRNDCKYLLENDVGWDFEEKNAHAEKLVSGVDVIGRDTEIFDNCISQGIGDVATVQLHHEESENKEWQNDEINPAISFTMC